MADWTGPSNHLTSLHDSCCPVVSAYPDGGFHSCDFGAGLAWFGSSNGWTYGAVDPLEL